LQLDFGQTQVGTVSDALYVTFTNTGTTDVTLVSTITGTNLTDFVGDNKNSCDNVLAQGTCSLAIHFAPTGIGPRSAEIRVQRPTGDTVLVPLTGTGA
jgi:hypothetical protein